MNRFNNRIGKILSVILILVLFVPFLFTSNVYAIESKELLQKTLLEGQIKDKNIEVYEIEDPDEEISLIIEIDEKAGKDLRRGRSLEEVARDKNTIDRVLKSQEKYIGKIRNIDKDLVVENNYSLLINGFSIKTKRKFKKKIEKIDGISVSIEDMYYRDTNAIVDSQEIKQIWEDYGYKGKGKVIAVLDSGVDHLHKDMRLSSDENIKLTEEKINEIKSKQKEKGGRYFTSKIPFGYNYADKNNDIRDRVESDLDYCHGMHVAGIIAGNASSIAGNKGVVGVAPESQILAMKIFSNNEAIKGASEGDIITAIEDSVAYGADVINMSFGMTAGFDGDNDAQGRAIESAIDEGVVVVAAAGNGSYSTYPNINENVIDSGTLGSPGLNKKTIQVASYENKTRVVYIAEAKLSGEKEDFTYVRSDFDPNILEDEYEVVYCGLGSKEDLETLDLKGKIGLVERGGDIYFKDKKLRIQEKGAVGVIIYNSEGLDQYEDSISTDKNVKIPTVFTINSDGKRLKKLIDKGVKVSFTDRLKEVENGNKDEMSYFSAWGPTPRLELKPDITGIGGKVWSTINDNEYKNMSGTSMATPYVAGFTALILEHLDGMDIKFNSNEEKINMIKTMIMNTADIKDDKNNKPYSPRLQGAGLINPRNALENKVTLTSDNLASITLREIEDFRDISLEIKNNSDEDLEYSINLISDNSKFTLDKEVIKLNKNDKKIIKGRLEIGEDVKENSYIEGYIELVARDKNHVSISLPFLGFYGDWGSLDIFDEPSTSENSVFKLTSLYTTRQEGFLLRTQALGGEEMNEKYFSINPMDINSHNNVLPQFSLMRNAKKLKINVTNEEGEILKVLEDRENVGKNIGLVEKLPAKVNFDWIWEGKIYDKDEGIQKVIDEGQYYINLQAEADFDGAKEQKLTLPIKIDKTAPVVSSNVFITDKDKCLIEMDARDKGKVDSGIEKFLFLLNGKKYMDEEGEFIFRLKEDNDGKYRYEFNLPRDNNQILNTIDIGVTDYANNMGAGKAYILSLDRSKLNIETDKREYRQGEASLLSYSSSNKDVEFYEISMDNLDNILYQGRDNKFTLLKDLGEGDYKIFVKGFSKNGKLLDMNYINLKITDEIKEEGDLLVVENATEEFNIKNGEIFEAKARARNRDNRDKKLVLTAALYDNNNKFINSASIEKNIKSGETVDISTGISIPDKGKYKVKLMFWDSISKMNRLLPYMEVMQNGDSKVY